MLLTRNRKLTVCTVLVLGAVAPAQRQAADHWSFAPPRRPPVPEDGAAGRAANPIDHFVLRALDAAGQQPSPPADRATLLRRVTLALTGLPPTPDQVRAFLGDDSVDAYSRLVGELLGSTAYAEHMTRWWLDQARYADTNGYHVDGKREMWKWREWVIEAFRSGMPFDRFTIEQLAGDLLPDRTIQTLVASGFNRNNMTNIEGGADPAEYSVRYVVDRVNTTSTVWLGLTVKCAECHDHKFDPITQKDYYSLFALFNNVPESGLDGYYGNAAPFIPVPDAVQQAALGRVAAAIADAKHALQALEPELERGQRGWEQRQQAELPAADVEDGLLLHLDMDEAGATLTDRSGSGVHASVRGANEAHWCAGKPGRAIELSGTDTHLDCGPVADFGRSDAFSIAAWIKPKSGGSVVSRIADSLAARGYELGAVNRKVWLQLSHHWPSDALRVTLAQPLVTEHWYHVCATYDGSGKAAGVRLYVDGERRSGTVEQDTLRGSIHVEEPLRIGRREQEFAYSGAIDDVRIYHRVLAAAEVARLARRPAMLALAVPAADRDQAQLAELRDYYREHVSVAAKAARDKIDELQGKQHTILEKIPTTMVMAELPEPRPAHVLLRGNYRNKGARVTAAVPAFLPQLPADQPANRLTFARWLVRADNPLTSRVIVNRLWALVFGRGLVATTGDFGTRGSPPTHPELLDWLATEFVSSGWDVRHMLRLMVESATFRQRSVVRPEDLASDPDDTLLGRCPRPRLQAEEIRDSALLISGLLDRRVGGPSVRPYQPPGLWKEVAFGGDYPAQVYVQSEGPDLYRRGLYVYWKRSAPYPSFRIFDAPTRELCTVSRPVTNTPLQALVLLDDPVYLEAARALAVRMLREGGSSDRERLAYGVRLCVTRAPRAGELDALEKLLAAERQRLAGDAGAVHDLVTIGPYRHPSELGDGEVAAWTMVASALLNTSELITRP